VRAKSARKFEEISQAGGGGGGDDEGKKGGDTINGDKIEGTKQQRGGS